MAAKTFSSIFVVLVLVAAMATSAPKAEAQLIQVTGTVGCSADATVSGTSTPPTFPNAPVSMVCGNTVVASTTTNSAGIFSIGPRRSLLSLPLIIDVFDTECRAVVTASLSSCNASLPSQGRLVSPLELTGTTFLGGIPLTSFLATRFQLVP